MKCVSISMQGGHKPVALPDNANIVAVAPPTERFAYLPISVPSAASAALRRAAAPALLPIVAGARCTFGINYRSQGRSTTVPVMMGLITQWLTCAKQ